MSTSEESPFDYDELFFSRTDAHGVILSGNSVFRRVSAYGWDELLGKPHNLVRHPDMPKGVFQLFWDTVQQDSPISAYVKNRSKDGRHYWVYALAQPVEGGYVSVRFKPSSPLHEVVKGEYERLLNLERSKKLTPAQSKAQLLADLLSLGIPDYAAFMRKSLMEELASRQAKLGRPPLKALEKLAQLVEQNEKLQAISSELSRKFTESTFIPLNMIIEATKLNASGDTLTVVASQYEKLSQDIKTAFQRFEEASALAKSAIANCIYNVAAGLLQREALAYFKGDKNPGPIDTAHEMGVLSRLESDGRTKSALALTNIGIEFDRFRSVCEQLRTLITGLEIVRITGKIEVARIEGEKEHLDHLILELLRFKRYLDGALAESVFIGMALQSTARGIASDLDHG